MALTAQTRTIDCPVGSMRMIGGTFTGSGTSGDLVTGLSRTAFLLLQPSTASANSTLEQATVNESLPAVDPITIGFTTGGITGYWLVFGW